MMTWHELSQASPEDLLAWAADQPWCRAMADCRQDAGWHSEGDVWTHTKMVCAELQQLREWPGLTSRERTVLLFTALLHDSAKPLTSHVDPQSGRIRSPKHAVKGEQLARHVLREAGCDLPVREEIARLVRYHGRPAFLLERPEPDLEVISLSWLVNHKLLYLFALADTRGRISQDGGRPAEVLELWKELAQEHDCFDRPYNFANDHARFLFYRQRKPDRHYVPHEDYRNRVILMSGIPGSGKDTWLQQNEPQRPTVSLDEIRRERRIAPTENQGEIVQIARERCREFLRSGTPFALNATNLLRQTRRAWIDLFADYGARIELVYIEPPWNVILQQNQQRENSVPEQVVEKLARKCEPPTWTEAHQLILTD